MAKKKYIDVYPNELCARCTEWIGEEEADITNDIPHCMHSGDADCFIYMNKCADKCHKFNER